MEITAVAMANAIRAILEEVGEDPREAALLAFGGAGPLFGTLLARELDIRTIVVPNYAGNFSAWGLLLQDLSRAAARTVVTPLTEGGASKPRRRSSATWKPSSPRAAPRPARHSQLGDARRQPPDLRYQGQEYFLTVDVPFAAGVISGDLAAATAAFESDYEEGEHAARPSTRRWRSSRHV